MKRRNTIEEDLRQLHCPDDQTVEELAAQYPALDAAALDRIDALCERKLSERMNTMTSSENMPLVSGVTKITRTQWFRPVTATAACLLIAAGIAGTSLLGGKMPSVTPMPPVSTENNDPTAASAETQTGTETTAAEAPAVIVTETVISEVTTEISTETTTAVESAAAASTAAIAAATAASTEAAAADPADVIIEGLTMTDLYALFNQNIACLEYYFLSPLPVASTTNDPDGYIFEVTSDTFASYSALESFVRSTYTANTAQDILTTYPSGGQLYLESNGKLCRDDYYVIGGFDYAVDWDHYQITNPAVVSENCLTFDIVTDYVFDTEEGEKYAETCYIVRENGTWKLDDFYGMEKMEYDRPSKEETVLYNKNVVELHALAEAAMGLDIYCIENEPLDGTKLYAVDYTHAGVSFTDGKSFEAHVRSIYDDAAAEYILNDYIYRIIDNKVYIDTEKADMESADSYVNWTEFTVESIDFEYENTCTFRIFSNYTFDAYKTFRAVRTSDGWRMTDFPTDRLA